MSIILTPPPESTDPTLKYILKERVKITNFRLLCAGEYFIASDFDISSGMYEQHFDTNMVGSFYL